MMTIDPEMLKNVIGGACPNCQGQAAAGAGEEGQPAAREAAAQPQPSKRERLIALLTPIINQAIQTFGSVASTSIQARASAGPAAGPQGKAPTATA